MFWQTTMRRLPPRRVRWRSSWLANILALFCILYIFFWNLGSLGSKYPFPARAQWLARFLSIDQIWTMFVSTPGVRGQWKSFWYVIPARLKDGTEVDLFKEGGPVDWEKPKVPSKLYKNRFWRKYLSFIWASPYQAHWLYYAWWLCTDWNKRHESPKQVRELELFLLWKTPPSAEDHQRYPFYTYSCPETTFKK